MSKSVKALAVLSLLVMVTSLAAGCKPKQSAFAGELIQAGKLIMANNLTYPPMECQAPRSRTCLARSSLRFLGQLPSG